MFTCDLPCDCLGIQNTRRRLVVNEIVPRSEVKFVKRNYEEKIKRALKTDKAFRDFVEIAPCGHRGCGVPCKRWEVNAK